MYTPAVTMVAAWISARHRRWTFHRIRQPYIQWKLRRFPAGAHEQQQRSCRNDRIPNGEVAGARRGIHVHIAQRSHVPSNEKHSQQESCVANAVRNERFICRVTGRLPLEIKSDQQIRTQPNALPSHKHQHIVIGENEREHGEHEQVHVPEEAVVPALMRHVSGGINVDEHPDPGHEQQPDAGKRIEQESRVGLEIRLCSAVGNVIQVPGIGSKPGVKNLFKRLMIVGVGPGCILQHRATSKEKRQHHHADADRVHGGLLHPPAKEKHDGRA